MNYACNRGRAISDVPPQFAPAARDSLLIGGRNLRRAFLRQPVRQAARRAKLADPGQSDPDVLLIRNGFACRSCFVADGRRAILDVLTSDDIIGLENVVLAGLLDEFVASSPLNYWALPASELRRLMATDPSLALRVHAVLAETGWRISRLAVRISRLSARGRICLLLLDIYERLRQRELIHQPTYNFPLTQEQIADHLGMTLVHVNRTLRRLRETGVVSIERKVVTMHDVDRIRALAQGLGQFHELGEGAETYAPPT